MRNLYAIKCNTDEIFTDNAYYVICHPDDIQEIAFQMGDDLYDPDGSKFTNNCAKYLHGNCDFSAATGYAEFCRSMAINVTILRIEEDTDWNNIEEAQEFYGCGPQLLLDEDKIENPEKYA